MEKKCSLRERRRNQKRKDKSLKKQMSIPTSPQSPNKE